MDEASEKVLNWAKNQFRILYGREATDAEADILATAQTICIVFGGQFADATNDQQVNLLETLSNFHQRSSGGKW